MYTRGYGGQIGWRLAAGKVAVDANAMMEGRHKDFGTHLRLNI
jgi:hypothetical protein